MIEQPNDSTPHVWISGQGNSGIAKIEVCDYEDGLGERITDEDQTNARLIAAAPDLLAALEYAVAQYGQPGGPWNVPSNPGDWLDRARMAIAKAKGEVK